MPVKVKAPIVGHSPVIDVGNNCVGHGASYLQELSTRYINTDNVK